MIGADHVRRAAALCASFLDRHVEADWTGPIPGIEMSVGGAVAHAAEGCLWYAIDLAAGGADLPTVSHRVDPDGAPADLIATAQAYAEVVASVIDAAPATARGYHPMGQADPSGFAAMACDELLIHTDDAARGLGAEFRPADELSDTVRRRLFPWSSGDGDPWQELRWCNGRIALGARVRLENWAWHCAPLDEWDGTVAVRR